MSVFNHTRKGYLLVGSAIACGTWLACVPVTGLLAPFFLVIWWMRRSFGARSGYPQLLLVVGLAALALRVLAVCVNGVAAYHVFGFAQPWDIIGDASSYHSHGYYIAHRVTGAVMPPYYKIFVHDVEHGGVLPAWNAYQVTGFSYWTAWLSATFTPTPAMVQLANVLLNLTTALLCFHVAGRWIGRWAAAASFIGIAWYPTLFAWSVSGLKEWSVTALSMGFILLLGTICQRPIPIARLVMAVFFLVGMAACVFVIRRDVSMVLTAIAVLLGACRLWMATRAWPGRQYFAFMLACAIVVTVLRHLSSLDAVIDRFFERSAILCLNNYFAELTASNYRFYPERYYEHFSLLSQGILVGTRFTFVEQAVTAAQGVARLMGSPFPDTLYRSRLLWALIPLAALNAFLAPLVLVGIWRGLKANAWLFGSLAGYLVIMAMAVGLRCGNAGLAIRLRDMLMPCYLLFAAIGAHVLVAKLASARQNGQLEPGQA